MTPEQKIKWAILEWVAKNKNTPVPPYPCDNIDERYAEANEEGLVYDAKYEIRESGIETGLKCEWSRHYESDAVAMKMPDGSWVGWTYWYGGGKHGEPAAIDWMEEAYDVDCIEEQKMVTVRTFNKK